MNNLARRALDKLSCNNWGKICDCEGCRARQTLEFAIYDGESMRTLWYKITAQLGEHNASWIAHVGKSGEQCCIDEIRRLQAVDASFRLIMQERRAATPADQQDASQDRQWDDQREGIARRIKKGPQP